MTQPEYNRELTKIAQKFEAETGKLIDRLILKHPDGQASITINSTPKKGLFLETRQLKYRIFHLWEVFNEMDCIIHLGMALAKTDSNVLSKTIIESVQNRFNRMVINDFYSFRKEWDFIKQGIDNKNLVDEVETSLFGRIDQRWGSLEQFRLEVGAHAFGTMKDKSISVFSPEGLTYYEIPLNWNETMMLVLECASIMNRIGRDYKPWFREFERRSFPKSDFTDHFKPLS